MASRERRSSGTLPSWERRSRGRSSSPAGKVFPVDGEALASGKQRRTVGVAAAEGQDQDYQDPDLEPVADGNDGVDSAGDSVTSVSVGSGSGSVSADSRGEDNGVTSCQVAATDTAPGAGDLKGVTGTGNRGAILEEAPQGSGRASSGGGTARNVSVRKLSKYVLQFCFGFKRPMISFVDAKVGSFGGHAS